MEKTQTQPHLLGEIRCRSCGKLIESQDDIGRIHLGRHNTYTCKKCEQRFESEGILVYQPMKWKKEKSFEEKIAKYFDVEALKHKEMWMGDGSGAVPINNRR